MKKMFSRQFLFLSYASLWHDGEFWANEKQARRELIEHQRSLLLSDADAARAVGPVSAWKVEKARRERRWLIHGLGYVRDNRKGLRLKIPQED